MRRKPFKYTLLGTAVTITQLVYETPDSEPTEGESVTFDASELPAEFAVGEGSISLLAYGLSQFLQDRTSSANTEDKLEGMKAVFERLQQGEWKAQRESSGAAERKVAIDPFFAQGFAQFLASKGKDVDVATATAMLQSMEKDQRAAIRTHEEVKAFVDKAKADALVAAGSIDLAALLG